NILADGSGLTGGKGYPLNTGVTAVGGLPNINITGFFAATGSSGIGAGHNRPSSNGPNPFYDFQDNVSYLRGKHSFKVGGEFAHIEVDTFTEKITYGAGSTSAASGLLKSPVPHHWKTSSPEIQTEDLSLSATRSAQ